MALGRFVTKERVASDGGPARTPDPWVRIPYGPDIEQDSNPAIIVVDKNLISPEILGRKVYWDICHTFVQVLAYGTI